MNGRMFQHIVDNDLASKIGLNESIMLKSIAYWVFKNESNNHNLKDGRYWTYNSLEAFSQQFPFWTVQNIRTILKHLVENGLVLKGHFNAQTMKNTTWYTLSDEGLALFGHQSPVCENQQTDLLEPTNYSLPEPTNRLVRTNKLTNIQNNTIQRGTTKDARAKNEVPHVPLPFDRLPDSPLKTALLEYRKQKQGTTSPLTEYTEALVLQHLEEFAPGDEAKKTAIVNRSLMNGWKDIYPLREDEPKHSSSKFGGGYRPMTASEAAEQAGQGALALIEQLSREEEKGDMPYGQFPF